MRHWRLFEELIDMQAEANRFFEDVYRRLAMFEFAMSRWNALDTLDTWDELRRMPHSGRSMVSERTERRWVIEGKPASAPAFPPETGQIQIEAVSGREALQKPTGSPAVDVIEQGDGVLIRAELPGLQPGDIQVSLDRGTLHFRGKIEYSMPLPEGVDERRIRATYRHGLLEVKLPRPSQERSIEVVFEDHEPEPYY